MFRKHRTVKQLSADELKTKLYSHFDKSGSLNRMRTELRGKLVSELLKVAAPLETSVTDEVFVDFEKALLPLQVSNWLIYDHLLKQGHQYALSIFVSEANLAQPEKLLTACDILCLFGLDSTTPEYKSISKMYSTNDEHGCFHSLLLAVIKSLFDFSHREDQQQTKTELADKEFRDVRPKELLHELSPKHILLQEKEQNMPFYSRNDELDSLKLRELRQSREDVFSRRNKSTLSEKLQTVIEENKRENQGLRQKLLQELDRLHAQERSQCLEIEHERHRMKREHDVLLAEKEKLKEKELLLTKEYENKLERKIRELETDFASKVHSKEKTLEDLHRKLFEKDQRLAQIEEDFSSQQTSFGILKKDLEDMRNMHKTVHEKYSSLLNDNTNLLKKFEGMSDYAVVKGELEAKSRQVSDLQREIGDITKTSEKEKGALAEIVRNLETKSNAKDSELLEAQRQLNVTRDTLHMKEAVWSKERRKLEHENLQSKDMYRAFNQKLEDQKGDIQALHQTIHLLHYQLTEKDTRSSSTSEPFMRRRAAFATAEGAKNEPEVFRISRNWRESPPKYKENNLKFIEDAKNKIFKLQQQEDELQDKCSIIYSSVPEFNNQFSSNPLVFNATNTQYKSVVSDPIKKFSANLNDNFQNLIGNEMPTLDLSFPANIKNSLASTFTDIYTAPILKASEIASNTVPTINTSTSRVNSSLKNIVTSTGMVEHDINLKDSEYLEDKNHYSSQDTDNVVPQLSNLKDPLKSDCTAFPNTKGTISKHLTSDNSIKTNQTQVKSLEKLTSDISSSAKEATTTEGYEIPEGNFQVGKSKLSEPKPNMLDSIVSNVESRSSTDSVPTVDSEGLKPDVLKQSSGDLIPKFADDLPHNDASKSATEVTEDLVSKTTEDAVLKDAIHAESVIDVPIVVDLDAAWKRKSSLPFHSPSQHESLTKLQAFEPPIIPNTPLMDVSKTNITSSRSNSEEPLHCPDDKTDSQNVSDASNVGSRHESADRSETESSKRVGTDAESKDPDPQQEILKPVVTEKQDFPTNEFVSEDASKPIDAELIKDAASEAKNVHEDSLSELSEIHLSCGSEQEQQKEDSDNW